MQEVNRGSELTWDLTRLFRADDDPGIEEAIRVVERESYRFIRKWKSRRDYLSDPSVLCDALKEYDRWKGCFGADGDAGYYFWLRAEQDQNNPDLKARLNKVEEFSRKIENDIQFFHLRLAKIPRKKRNSFLRCRGLRRYRHFLENIWAESKYLMSEREEKILNVKMPTSYSNWIKMTFGLLSKEERKISLEGGGSGVRPFSEITALMNSSDKKTRDSAARAFNDILTENLDVAEAEINSVLSHKKTEDELRAFSRPDLSRHVADDIDSRVVDSLIASVSKRFDIPSWFYELKARLMGLRKLKYHERNVVYGNIKTRYSFEASCNLVRKVLHGLDQEFGEIFDGFVSNRQIDVYPKKGKSGGAFCAHHLISQPTYILLNHTGELGDVLTLAHEVGHGINNELIRRSQNALNFGTPTSTAEVASTFLEDFVLQEILKKSGGELKLAIMMKKLDDDVSTIFRQVACYRFEMELHELFRQKGYLSKEEIGKLFAGHMAGYMGDYVEQTSGSENWWVYWSHIRYFFYVYSYASGLLISKSLQSSVKNAPVYINRVKNFLSAGLSDSPKNIFLSLGIEIENVDFWNRGIEEVDCLLEETARQARRLGKLR